MPDDLDALLSDVDDSHAFSNAEAAEKRLHEQEMRRGDRVVIDPEDSNTATGFARRVGKAAANPDLDPFRKGYLNAMAAHSASIAKFRELTSDKAISDGIAAVMKKYRYTFSRSIESIEKIYSEFVTSYNPDMIMKKNRQDFYLFFQSEEMDQNRLDFLLIKEIFLRLREYNSYLRKEWEDLQKGIGVINLVSDSKTIYTDCNKTIDEALQFCSATDTFARFLAVVLGMPDGEYDVLERDIANKVVYFESFRYAYDEIFKNTGDSSPKERGELDDILPKFKPAISVPEKKSPDAAPAEHSFKRAEASCPSNFTVRGTCAWNRIEPYIIRIDGAKLSKDSSDMDAAVHFNAEIPDPVKVNGIVKRAMLRFIKDQSLNIKSAYTEFVFKTISVQIQDIADSLGIPDERMALFAYHLAPLTVWKLLIDIFTETQVGVCYKMLSDNRVSRFIPQEYLKEKTMEWFEQNINQLDLPFDRVSEYSEFKRIVLERYNAEKERSIQKIDLAAEQFFQKTGKRLDKDALLKNKAKELFGTRMIPVYNRFIDRTIFK